MEENKPIFNDLQVDFIGSQHLKDTYSWAKFIAILFISLAGLLLFFFLISWNKLKVLFDEASGNGSQVMTAAALILIAVAAVLIVMMFFLLRSMNRIRTSLRTKDQQLFHSGLQDLKIYFTIFGIISILMLLTKLISFF
jgi:ABC-type multidrug transport system fused ATPase/permease subunit